jgi:nucleotide-binding universal stress UspA family protein
MELKRVLVGLDGSEAAAAARWAAEAVQDCGGEVLAVHAVETFPVVRQAAQSAGRGLGILSSGVTDREEESSRALDERWCRPLRDAGVPYRTVLEEADPVQALLDTARREDADLIVVGHQGGTGFLHRLFRELSDQLIDHAERPVVVVPFHSSRP